MNWTAVFVGSVIVGLAIVVIAAFAPTSFPDCGAFGQLEIDRVDACYAEYDPQRRFYAAVYNAGFAVLAVGALGLVGRYTGLLRG
jgi:hypothetical protein